MTRRVVPVCAALCCLVLVACGGFTTPAPQQQEGPGHRPQALALTPKQELSLGKQAYEEAVKQLVRYVTWWKDRPKDVRKDRHRKLPTMPIPWGQRPLR